MEKDIRRFFSWYVTQQPGVVPEFARVAVQLCRAGVTDMNTLCELMADQPEKVRDIRNIGEKSMALIQTVCEAYRSKRGDDL